MLKYIFYILLFIIPFQLSAQNRKDLLWEYKKLQSNDSHLGILLTDNPNNCPNNQIIAILDSAWTKKKCIILLQTLGFLDNSTCSTPYFSENEINRAINKYKASCLNSSQAITGKELVDKLFDTYLKSTNDEHLSYKIVSKQLIYDRLDILLVVFKYELKLQLWVKPRKSFLPYTFIKSFTATDPNVSNLGPKSRYGDQLTPEGIYRLEFYPSLRWSDFYLAFRITYPNQFDLIRRQYWQIREKSGGDINIHGSCVSIGCIPIGNQDIIELFLLIRANQKQGNSVHIHIYPLMFDRNYSETIMESATGPQSQLMDFWRSLSHIYTYFYRTKHIPKIVINNINGYYLIDKI